MYVCVYDFQTAARPKNWICVCVCVCVYVYVCVWGGGGSVVITQYRAIAT